MSLVFYDTETTGVETFFDQILQFAAIRTDEDLNEIDRFEVRCRLLPHIIPSPDAMLVNRVSVAELTDASLPSHYEMVRAIREKLVSWSPSLFIGWNSIKFDEDLMRQALYKTLHNPYLTNTAGNSRSDAIRIVQACSVYAPEAIALPVNGEGRKLFKLDQVAPLNGFNHERAHDAVCDVEAIVHICQLIMEKAPHVWSSFMRFSKKATVEDYIAAERIFCVSDFFNGKVYSHLVTVIGQNQQNKAEWYVYDLNVAPDSLRLLDDARLSIRLTQTPKPIRKIKSNAAPMIFASDDAPEDCSGQNCGSDELERRASIIQADRVLRDRLTVAFESTQTKYPISEHVEKQIYDGFFDRSAEILMEAFHAATWSERPAIVEKFQDARLKEIGKRLIYTERPDLLDAPVSRQQKLLFARRVMGHGNDATWVSIPTALKRIEEISAGLGGAEREQFDEYVQFLGKIQAQAIKYLS